jgi:ribonuclease HI
VTLENARLYCDAALTAENFGLAFGGAVLEVNGVIAWKYRMELGNRTTPQAELLAMTNALEQLALELRKPDWLELKVFSDSRVALGYARGEYSKNYKLQLIASRINNAVEAFGGVQFLKAKRHDVGIRIADGLADQEKQNKLQKSRARRGCKAGLPGKEHRQLNANSPFDKKLQTSSKNKKRRDHFRNLAKSKKF